MYISFDNRTVSVLSVEYSFIEKDCGEPATVANSTKTANGTLYGDTIEYACNEGFNLNGGDTITCQATGIWSAEPSCQRR